MQRHDKLPKDLEVTGILRGSSPPPRTRQATDLAGSPALGRGCPPPVFRADPALRMLITGAETNFAGRLERARSGIRSHVRQRACPVPRRLDDDDRAAGQGLRRCRENCLKALDDREYLVSGSRRRRSPPVPSQGQRSHRSPGRTSGLLGLPRSPCRRSLRRKGGAVPRRAGGRHRGQPRAARRRPVDRRPCRRGSARRPATRVAPAPGSAKPHTRWPAECPRVRGRDTPPGSPRR